MVQVYVGRIQKYVGAYMMKLRGKVDAIVVAGGAGEASSDLRQRLFSHMQVSCALVCMQACKHDKAQARWRARPQSTMTFCSSSTCASLILL